MSYEDSFHLGIKVLVRNKDQQVLLLKGENKRGSYWDLPGGRIQKGESSIDTIRRELEEEIGLTHIQEIKPLIMTLTNIRIPVHMGDVGLIFSIYQLDIPSTFTPRLSSEHTHFEWCGALEAAKHLQSSFPSEFITMLKNLNPKILA